MNVIEKGNPKKQQQHFVTSVANCLLAVPHSGDLGVSHLLLQLEDTEHKGFGGGRAARDVDVDGDDAVTAAGDGVGVVVVTATVGARAHGDNPARVGHLIVDLAEGGSHLVGQGTSDDHYIGLTGRGTENNTHTILIVTRSRQVHHLDGAAGETEGHGPQRTLTGPVGDLIKSGPVGMLSATDSASLLVSKYIQSVLHDTLLALLAGKRDVCGHALLHGWRGAWVALDEAGPLHGC